VNKEIAAEKGNKESCCVGTKQDALAAKPAVVVAKDTGETQGEHAR
jgi:hypothetical protein